MGTRRRRAGLGAIVALIVILAPIGFIHHSKISSADAVFLSIYCLSNAIIFPCLKWPESLGRTVVYIIAFIVLALLAPQFWFNADRVSGAVLLIRPFFNAIGLFVPAFRSGSFWIIEQSKGNAPNAAFPYKRRLFIWFLVSWLPIAFVAIRCWQLQISLLWIAITNFLALAEMIVIGSVLYLFLNRNKMTKKPSESDCCSNDVGDRA